MTTHTAIGSTDNLATADDECIPGLLTEAELETVVVGGEGEREVPLAEIGARGVAVEDTRDGQRWRRLVATGG